VSDGHVLRSVADIKKASRARFASWRRPTRSDDPGQNHTWLDARASSAVRGLLDGFDRRHLEARDMS
jgi:hypothetical protein